MPAAFDYFMESPIVGLVNTTLISASSNSSTSNHGGSNVVFSWVFLVPILFIIVLLPVAKFAYSKGNCWKTQRLLDQTTASSGSISAGNIKSMIPLTENDLEFSATSDEEEAVAAVAEQVPWNSNIMRAKESYSSTFAAWMTPQPTGDQSRNFTNVSNPVPAGTRSNNHERMKKMESLTSPSVKTSVSSMLVSFLFDSCNWFYLYSVCLLIGFTKEIICRSPFRR
jgi:hypothetical protein